MPVWKLVLLCATAGLLVVAVALGFVIKTSPWMQPGDCNPPASLSWDTTGCPPPYECMGAPEQNNPNCKCWDAH